MERELYVYRYVDQPFGDVVRLLREGSQHVLDEATGAARRRADDFSARVHGDVAGFDVGREVTVALGAPEHLDVHCVSFPVRWAAEDGQGLFPSLRGRLEIAALSEDPPLSQVSFMGEYRPPLGGVGTFPNAALGHRVVEAAVLHFIGDLAARIDDELDRSPTVSVVRG